jgi:superfamily II DNA or RNA helicase
MRIIKADSDAKVKASENRRSDMSSPAIEHLKFPFNLKRDQIEAVEAWIKNDFRGSIVYSTGTGKTEIAFECARLAARARTEVLKDNANNANLNRNLSDNDSAESTIMKSVSQFRILLLVPRIVLIEQNVKRLLKYGIPKTQIGVYFGEKKEVREITISTYQSIILMKSI